MQAYNWLDDLITLELATPERLAVMAWVYAHAGDGFEVGIDDMTPAHIAEEIKAPVHTIEAALKVLKELGMLTPTGGHPSSYRMTAYDWRKDMPAGAKPTIVLRGSSGAHL